jgi:TolA-binding protein
MSVCLVTLVSGQDLNSIIDRYEKLLYDRCADRKTAPCAEFMYTLGSLYYDQAKEQANKNKTEPDYRKSLNMYWQVAIEYPKFEKLPEAYIQMSTVYLLSGHFDTTRIVLEQLVDRFPNSPRASSAHFSLGDLTLRLDSKNIIKADSNDISKAYRHFTKVKKNEVDITMWEMTQFYLGACAYRQGDFDKALEYLRGYVEEYDKGTYKNKMFSDVAHKLIRTIMEQQKK